MRQTIAVFTREVTGPSAGTHFEESVTGPQNDLPKMRARWWEAIGAEIMVPDGYNADAKITFRQRTVIEQDGFAQITIEKSGTRSALDSPKIVELNFGFRDVDL